jgi:hypothetical protein
MSSSSACRSVPPHVGGPSRALSVVAPRGSLDEQRPGPSTGAGQPPPARRPRDGPPGGREDCGVEQLRNPPLERHQPPQSSGGRRRRARRGEPREGGVRRGSRTLTYVDLGAGGPDLAFVTHCYVYTWERKNCEAPESNPTRTSGGARPRIPISKPGLYGASTGLYGRVVHRATRRPGGQRGPARGRRRAAEALRGANGAGCVNPPGGSFVRIERSVGDPAPARQRGDERDT